MHLRWTLLAREILMCFEVIWIVHFSSHSIYLSLSQAIFTLSVLFYGQCCIKLAKLPGRMRPIGANEVRINIGTKSVSEKNGVFLFISKSTTSYCQESSHRWRTVCILPYTFYGMLDFNGWFDYPKLWKSKPIFD